MKKILLFLLCLTLSLGFAGYSNFDELELDKNTGKVRWTNDPNTYIQRSAADTLILVTGGTTRGTINSSGFTATNLITSGTLSATGKTTVGGLDFTVAAIEVDSISGTINVTQVASQYTVDTAGSVATSDVNVIAGCVAGQTLILRNLNATHDVTYIDSATLALGGDITLGDATDTLTLLCTGAATQIRLSDGAN